MPKRAIAVEIVDADGLGLFKTHRETAIRQLREIFGDGQTIPIARRQVNELGRRLGV